MIKLSIGNPVVGKDFFGRQAEEDQLWECLENDHLLLLAPRRVGKTSLMWQLRNAAPNRGFDATYCSVADASEEISFMRKLYETVLELEGSKVLRYVAKTKAVRMLNRISKLEILKSSIEINQSRDAQWQAIGAAIADRLSRCTERTLIMIDELPVFLLTLLNQDPSTQRARCFLNWFRNLRQQNNASLRVRWLLAGSIGLDAVAARLNLGDTINDLHVVHLGAFSEPVAARFLTELSKSYHLPINDEVTAHLLKRIGWPIPFHLQIFFDSLRQLCSDRAVAPSIPIVDAVFEDLMRPARRAYFDTWRQRLEAELGRPDGTYALILLDSIAADPQGATASTLSQVLATQIQDAEVRAEKLRYLLDVLDNDGYIIKQIDRYIFRSHLLKAYWLNRVIS